MIDAKFLITSIIHTNWKHDEVIRNVFGTEESPCFSEFKELNKDLIDSSIEKPIMPYYILPAYKAIPHNHHQRKVYLYFDMNAYPDMLLFEFVDTYLARYLRKKRYRTATLVRDNCYVLEVTEPLLKWLFKR